MLCTWMASIFGLADALERGLDLGPRRRRVGAAAAASGDVELGGPEELVGELQLLGDAARRFFGRAVPGAVSNTVAPRSAIALNTSRSAVMSSAAGDLREGGRAAQPDHRNLLAARRDGRG